MPARSLLSEYENLLWGSAAWTFISVVVADFRCSSLRLSAEPRGPTPVLRSIGLSCYCFQELDVAVNNSTDYYNFIAILGISIGSHFIIVVVRGIEFQ
jgi:hypothetical protein